jgi:hypothetical protein
MIAKDGIKGCSALIGDIVPKNQENNVSVELKRKSWKPAASFENERHFQVTNYTAYNSKG